MRHRYDMDPGRGGVCTCGQGRSEDVHNLLVWSKSQSGSWVSNLTYDKQVYRCRPTDTGLWTPEIAEDGDWAVLDNSQALRLAKATCEEHREGVNA